MSNRGSNGKKRRHHILRNCICMESTRLQEVPPSDGNRFLIVALLAQSQQSVCKLKWIGEQIWAAFPSEATWHWIKINRHGIFVEDLPLAPANKEGPCKKEHTPKANSTEFVWICGLFLSSTFGIIFFEGLVQPPNNPQNALWSSEAISWRLSSTEPEMQKTTQRMIWLPGTTMPLNQPLSNDLSKALHMARV